MTGILQVDLFKINHLKLDLIQYLLLRKLYGQQNEIHDPIFYKIFDPPKEYYESLVVEGYLSKGLYHTYDLTDKALSLFRVEDLKFKEFYEMYPQKVPDGMDGYRPVSTNDPESKSAQRTRVIWERIVKEDPSLADKMLKGLEIELEKKRLSGSMMYLPNIDSWLNAHSWEKWLDMADSEKSDKNNKNNVRKI